MGAMIERERCGELARRHRWGAGRFTFPDGGGWAVKLFGDVGPQGRMMLTDPRRGERIEFSVDPGSGAQVGIWINCRGWAPPGRTPYYNLALEPCIGAPDRLGSGGSRLAHGADASRRARSATGRSNVRLLDASD